MTQNKTDESASILLNRLGAAFEKSRRELVKGARVGRLAMDIRGLEKDRAGLLQSLGEKCARALREGRVADPDLLAVLTRIDAVDQRITELEQQKEQVEEGLAESEGSEQNAPPASNEGG